MKMFPENRLGKWAVLLTLTFVLLLLIFFLFMTIGLVEDVPIGAVVIVELAGFVLSIMAIKKERAILTYCALFLGIIAILFLLTHSLFIND